MSVVWSGVTESGAVVPVQVDGLGRVIATTGEPPGPPVINYSGAAAWGNIEADGTINNGLNIARVSKLSVGTYYVLFRNAMPSDFYAVTLGATSYTSLTTINYNDATVSGFTVSISDRTGGTRDQAFSLAVHSINALPPTGTTGTDSWGSCQGDGTIKASFNVSSVTRTAAGKYGVVFTTPMPADNYAVTATARDSDTTLAYIKNATADGFEVATVGSSSGTGRDSSFSFTVNATNAALPVTYTREQLDAVINNWQKTGEPDTLSTKNAVEMNGPVRLAGGKAGFTDEGQLYFTPGPGPQKYLVEVEDGQMKLKRIDSAY